MNPIRQFGPALIIGNLSFNWIYGDNNHNRLFNCCLCIQTSENITVDSIDMKS
jgi:hypothetical protein